MSDPPLVIVHTPEVDDVKATVKLESEVADNVGVVPKFCVTGFANVIDWESKGVVELVDADALPVPALLVAVTVKV